MTELWFESAGDGPAVLLVHAGICDARMWDGVWPAVTASRRGIRCDLRGFGRTGPATESFAPHDDLISVLDAAGVERAALCGVSYGGKVAVETALAHSDRVSALAVVCSALDWSDAPAELRDAMEEADGVGEGGDVDRAVELELQIWVDGHDRTEPVDPAVREAVRVMNRLAWEHGLASDADSVSLDPPASERLGEIAVPTLVVAGEYDVPFMTESCRSFAVAVPRARFELVEGVAHLPPLERPDAFGALLSAFLTDVER